MKRKKRRKSRYKRGIINSIKGGECKYRSGWELSYINWLDANPSVISFLYEPLAISYVSNVKTNKIRNYYPDFIVTYDTHIELIEIKPIRKLKNRIVMKKIDAATSWAKINNVMFQIITEIELKALGLL